MSRPAGNGASPLVILAAGGTGGHLFPAQALAQALIDRGFEVALVTDHRGGEFGDAASSVRTYRIRAGRLRRNLADRIRALGEMALGGLDARRVIRALRPAVVVGFGGYPSIPTVLAAFLAGAPVILHEQNALLGRANRRLAARARIVATSFETVAGIPPGVRAALTGNPVRPGIAALRDRPYPASESGAASVLVTGGSQGAHIFSEVVPAALGLLPAAARRRLSVVQQCRAEDIAAARQAYESIGVAAELATFFADMPERLAAAHLVICRAGASTIAELGAAGRPAVLVPYPFATNDHQTLNARCFTADGAGWIIEQRAFTPLALAERLGALLADPALLVPAAQAARRQGRPDAAARLADLVAEQAGQGRNSAPAKDKAA
jgi:UDP-N-acetylglucosamine--N-acetylmuramyl-(pentapeptide) pyrophosphoryl-undecaprenol N-acetylglucosamine transferase